MLQFSLIIGVENLHLKINLAMNKLFCCSVWDNSFDVVDIC